MESNEQEDYQLNQLVDIRYDVHVLDKHRLYTLNVYFNLLHYSRGLKKAEKL